jgi:IgA Peptidase M64
MENKLITFFTAAALLFSAVSFAASGHYIVVTIDDSGKAQPVFYRAVNFSQERLASIAQVKAAHHDVNQLAVTGNKWREVAQVPRYIRGEFAINGKDGDIKAYQVEQKQRSFALRIPASAGDQINLNYMGVQSSLNVRQVVAKASQLALADTPVKNTKAFINSSNRVDILVLGDGYTAAEQATFNADAENLRVAMFNYTPYKEYASLVNWTTAFTPSQQSGVDHPPYQAGCTSTSCCADSAAQSDPRAAGAGVFVNTAFDGKFCTSQIHRLVTINSSKVYAAASAYPDWDQLVVLLNDPVYGGSGGSIAVTTTNANANLIVIHEYGHTFHDLADEYTSAYPGFPACSDISPSNSCEANVTNQTVPNLIKWKSWIAPTTPIPTTSGTAVGLFQGARYLSTGMYRPVNSCGMRNLGAPFCPVCTQAYILKLYRGGFGTPSSGIDLIEPGTEQPVASTPVAYSAGSTLNFSAAILRPNPDTLNVQWYLDGVPQAGANSNSFNFTQAAAAPSTRTLELRVVDDSPFVKAEMAGALTTHSRTWTINVASTALSLSVADAAVLESHSVNVATFDVTLSAPAPAGGVSFDVATKDLRSTGNAATSASDYVPVLLTRKTIAAGQTGMRVSVKIRGDKLIEPDEIYALNISNVSGAVVADGAAMGIILNDDQASALGNQNNAATASAQNTQPSCEVLQRQILALEARAARNRIQENEGVRSILSLENRRRQLACQ